MEEELIASSSTELLDWFTRKISIEGQRKLLFLRYLNLFTNSVGRNSILTAESENNELPNPNKPLYELQRESQLEHDTTFL